jgi:hypothetical protein
MKTQIRRSKPAAILVAPIPSINQHASTARAAPPAGASFADGPRHLEEHRYDGCIDDDGNGHHVANLALWS